MLDAILNRGQFAAPAKELVKLCQRQVHRGFIVSTAITDVFYIGGRCGIDLHQLYLHMRDFLEILKICEIKPVDIMEAMDQHQLDFEDCIMAISAKRIGCDLLITRNAKDFASLGIKCMTPKEFLENQNM